MLKSATVLSSRISISSLDSVSDYVLEAAATKERAFVCIANVHMVVTAKSNIYLKAAMEDACVVASDGMPLVWDLKRQGFEDAQRVSGPDLMILLCEKAQKNRVPIYFFGGDADTAQKFQRNLKRMFPELIVAGVESPPMLPVKPVVDENVINRIVDNKAGIVFVGLGCPKQELWMHAYSPHIPSLLIGVGAAFDFFAGTVKRAPVWMQKYGLEWLYRLCSEPQRLWKRYLVTNSLFIGYWLLERLRMSK